MAVGTNVLGVSEITLADIIQMKESVLTRALRDKLGTEALIEGNTIELLKRVLLLTGLFTENLQERGHTLQTFCSVCP